MPLAKTVHVYHSANGWAVKRYGGRASSLFSTRSEAIERARSIARKAAPSQMVVHGRDGGIKEYVTYGMPRVQEPPGNGPRTKKIQDAVDRVALQRFAT